MFYIQRKETYNGNSTPFITWIVKTTDPKALYKIIAECNTKKEAIRLVQFYNTLEG
jgi:hypothetical protein